MSDDIISTKRRGGKGKLVLIILVALLMGGTGIAGGLYAAGAFGHTAGKAVKEDPNRPRLVPTGGDPAAIAEEAAGGGGEGGHAPHVESKIKLPKGGVDLPHPKDVSAYQATYFQMPAPYTSNLSDTDSLVQIALAISTYYDARVIDAVKVHEMAIRSAILMMMAQEQEAEISTPQGKQALQRRLTAVINKILKEKTGYSGVDNVYFTNFVIQ